MKPNPSIRPPLVALAYILGVTVFLVSCESTRPNIDVTADDVLAAPEQFTGEFVTVSGRVGQLLGPRAFTIDAGPPADDLLIVTQSTALTEMPVKENETVQATGRVRRFDLNEVRKEVDYFLPDEMFTAWDKKPVLIARELDKRP